MKIKNISFVIFFVVVTLLIVACDAKGNKTTVYNKATINSAKLCESITYACLPDSKDENIKKILQAETTDGWLSAGDIAYNKKTMQENLATLDKCKKSSKVSKYCIQTKEKLKARNQEYFTQIKDKERLMNDEEIYVLSEQEEQAIKKRRKLRIYDEISQMLNLFFPGFWGDTPKEERIKWVKQVDKKSYEYIPDDLKQYGTSRGDLEQMAIICAILGINFNKNPKHESINKYISTLKTEGEYGQKSIILFYLYFVFLERDYGLGGLHLNT